MQLHILNVPKKKSGPVAPPLDLVRNLGGGGGSNDCLSPDTVFYLNLTQGLDRVSQAQLLCELIFATFFETALRERSP